MFFNFPEGEILYVNKPYKWTSFDVVGKIRFMLKHILGIKKIKVGHSGTLDPLATGLMIICTGKATKKIEGFLNLDKVYSGSMVLGAVTPSYDLETEVNQTFDISGLTAEDIIENSKKFLGIQNQVPPVFSAIKINGKRAYEMARNNQECIIEPKRINIKRFEITNVELPVVEFVVECSKGTYIRSLVRDFGESLDNGAYLASLRREAIGTITLADALSIEQLELLISQEKQKEVSQEAPH
ncbi:MAG TPA: tRNA pseudouridine(55) synthase TruB [Bacteroidales bacterium]|nr:tRNA pseudouridine(55) synthase TruB [Bacteroidales bacterium]